MHDRADVYLVPLGHQHLAQTRAWANDPALMRLMDRNRIVSETDHKAWFGSLASREDCAYFAIEEGEQRRHVGNVWLWAIDSRHRKAELRIVVGEPTARGRGVGRTAIDALCRDALERLDLHRVYAYVLAINPGAKRAFEQADFVVEGLLKDDRWGDGAFVDVWLLARVARQT